MKSCLVTQDIYKKVLSETHTQSWPLTLCISMLKYIWKELAHSDNTTKLSINLKALEGFYPVLVPVVPVNAIPCLVKCRVGEVAQRGYS